MRNPLLIMMILCLFACTSETPENSEVIYESNSFTIYKDKVVQGDNVAVVESPTSYRSNYKSPASTTFSRLIKFKFSINEIDNELPPGADHWVIIDTEKESPIVKFGETPPPFPKEMPEGYLPTNYEYTFRVDVSAVLEQFESQGYYQAHDESRVAKADFKGFYLAGGSEPLTWDFVNLENQGLKLQETDDPNIYSLTVTLNPYDDSAPSEQSWSLTQDLSNRAKYSSEQPLVDALFNMSLEEAIIAIEPDSTFRTGAKWGGVWTRDISYSIFLAFAYHEPEVAKTSLRKKVNRQRIIQDTGSGGAWPVSSDRTTWVLAAWEIYKATGDQVWLEEVYPIVKNTLDDDFQTIYDAATGLFSAESSFLDWREQTYPKWMNNVDIYLSHALGTNVVHYQAHTILAEMAELLGQDGAIYRQRADGIKKGINDLFWLEDQGYYAQFLYGRPDLVVSPKFEALGEALAILFDVADASRRETIVGQSPLTEFGTTCVYPQIPGIPPYHNNGIWPFVQSYWNLAAAKAGNEAVLNHGLASIYRAAGLFLTNYENMVAETGDFLGTEINSHRMLWSMAGNLAMVHRVFMGMQFEVDGLRFEPFVPAAYGGEKTLSNFTYRDATLTIMVKGHGHKIASFKLDGKEQDPFLPGDLSGQHTIEIILDNTQGNQDINLVDNAFTLPTPKAKIVDDQFHWESIEGAVNYRVYLNGQLANTTTETSFPYDGSKYNNFAVSAVDAAGYESFTSEPIVWSTNFTLTQFESQIPKANYPYTNFSGSGFVEVSNTVNRDMLLEVEVIDEGRYLLDVKYSNGNGRWNTNNKCAIRSLTVNDAYQGVLVFPQRGKDEWSDWGYSNQRIVELKAGKNKVRIHFEDWNVNMNVDVNQAMLDHLRLMKM
ncbi:MAG: glycogen debranching protein [Bacteroidota bacterium]